MRRLSHPDVLHIWERGQGLHPLDRSLLALAAAEPESADLAPADWPLGRRNRALAELRCANFGSRLQAWVACPECGEKLEFELDCRALAESHSSEELVEAGAHRYRLPTSRDLARAMRETDPEDAALSLIESCWQGSGEKPAWGAQDLEEIGNRMAAADPMAETRLTLECPACGKTFEESLSIEAFLWSEIESRARRLLFETHTLAFAYGWSESEILSLSDARRAFYLEMVQQ